MDGVELTQVARSYNPSQVINTAPDILFEIGAWTDYKYRFDGVLDEVRVYGRALSDAEIGNLAGIVNNPPVAVDDSYDAYEDSTLSVSVAAGVLLNDTDPDGHALAAILMSDVSNGSLVLNSNGSFSYTPNPGFVGTDSFTYNANDGLLYSGIATVTITVYPINHPPVAVDDSYSVDENTMLNISAPGVLGNDSDPDGDPLTVELAGDPANGTVTLRSDGSFTYNPNTDFYGTDSFTYKASDGLLPSEVVFSDNFDRPDSTDVDAISVGMSGLVAPVSYFERETASVVSGKLSLDGWTSLVVPEHDFTDASIVSARQFVIEFDANPPDTAGPEGYADGVAVSFGHSEATAKGGGFRVSYWVEKAFGLVLSGNAGMAPGRFEIHNAAAPLGWEDLAPIGGLWITFDRQPVADEWYHVKLTVRPNAGQQLFTAGHTATVLVEITGDLDANQNTASQDTFQAILEFHWVHGSNFVVFESGHSSYLDNFAIRTLGEAALSNVTTVTITVNPLNDAPVAVNDAYSVDEDNTLTVSAPGVLINDIDVENDPLTATLVSGPSNGSLTLSVAGSFIYTPSADFSGTDSFTYKANDSMFDSNSATVTLTVNQVNDAPVANDQSVVTDEDTPLAITLTASDVDNAPLTYSIVVAPAHGTLSGTAPYLTYTPAADYNGAENFTFKANDSTTDSNIATVTITVKPVNDAPVALADGPFLGVMDSPVSMDASASYDPDGDSLTFKWDFGDGSTLEMTEANIEHTYASAGTYTVTLVVNDGELNSTQFSTEANIGITGGGGRDDVDAFLAYVNPLEKSTDLPAGTASFDVTIIYGPTIDPVTFEASLNKEPFDGFKPVAGTSQTVTIPLSPGRNTLVLKVDGVRSDERTATDRDRLVFIVK
jgi:VCBS repeat-containing protein